MPQSLIVKLGAALGALAIVSPAAAASGQTPATGGVSFDDPAAPSVFADGSTLAAPVGQMLGQTVGLHGTVAGTTAGDPLVVQRLDRRAGWVGVANATVASDGSFEATWHADYAGHTRMRAIPAGQAASARTASGDDDDARPLTVFRPAVATWYGPGFYGRRTACGLRLTRATLGVAHRTLPCGTPVELFKDGRSITVPVIDRGPFRRGTTYDLTAATAQAIGMSSTATIGATLAAPPAVPAPA